MHALVEPANCKEIPLPHRLVNVEATQIMNHVKNDASCMPRWQADPDVFKHFHDFAEQGAHAPLQRIANLTRPSRVLVTTWVRPLHSAAIFRLAKCVKSELENLAVVVEERL